MTPQARLVVGSHYPDRVPAGHPLKGLHEGSAAARVLVCVRCANRTVLCREVVKVVKLSRIMVATALNELVRRGEIERTNEQAPFLYRAKK